MKTKIILYIFLPILVITNTQVYGTEISDSLTSFFSMDVEKDEIAIMWLGNHQKESLAGYASAGFLIKTFDNIILIDSSSLLSNDIDSLQKIDAIFITHNHGDHFNPDSTIQIQKKTGAIVIANPASFSMLTENMSSEKLLQIFPGEEITFSGFNVHAIPAEHPVENPLLYIIDFDGFRIFHGSDSGFVQELNEIKTPVDVALVPTGDPSPSASPTYAYDMTQALQASVVIPMHGNPTQMKNFASLIQESGLLTQVIIPKPLEVNFPSINKTSLAEEPKIPEWVKNNAGWWASDNISESEFLRAIEYLIENDIMKISITENEDLPSITSTYSLPSSRSTEYVKITGSFTEKHEGPLTLTIVKPDKSEEKLTTYSRDGSFMTTMALTSESLQGNYQVFAEIKGNQILVSTFNVKGADSNKVPGWIKNNADWWAQGLITDDDFVKGIQYLVEQGIIRV